MFPIWGTVTPFGTTIDTINGFASQLPTVQQINQVGFETFIQSANYANNVLQTECTGSANPLPDAIAMACAAADFPPETKAQATAALFWNDPGGTMQPPGHWLEIADTIVTQQELDLLQTARATATVGLALDDAGIGAWAIKYQDVAWRPMTAIQFSPGWNPYFTTFDPTWSSLIALPPHPDYVAGHPAFSGAAAT